MCKFSSFQLNPFSRFINLLYVTIQNSTSNIPSTNAIIPNDRRQLKFIDRWTTTQVMHLVDPHKEPNVGIHWMAHDDS